MSVCPSCSGPWLYNLVFRHTAGCPLGHAEDATTGADQERAWCRGLPFDRDATDTEVTLAVALGMHEVPEAAAATTTVAADGLRRRTITVNGAVFDPDIGTGDVLDTDESP